MINGERLLCRVYRSARREGMYLYLPQDADPADLPEALQKAFGTPQQALDLLLTPERKLARVSASEVLAKIAEQGFYLQMPPSEVEPPLALAQWPDRA